MVIPSTPVTGPRLLYRLQQVDSDLARTEEQLRTLDAGESARARLQELTEAHAAAQSELTERQSRIRTMELELQSAAAKRRQVEEEMYSGRVRNPKELAAMQEEIGQFDRHGKETEDAVIALMEEVEGRQPQVAGLGSEAAAARADLAHREAAYLEEQAALHSALASLRAERERVAAGIDPGLLRRYDRIRERMGAVAVAAVRRGICENCHVAIPEGRVRQLAEDAELVLTCERCGRILVLPD
jgi:hypothetical protein